MLHHYVAQAAVHHSKVLVVSTIDAVIGLGAGLAWLFGAEVPDGALVGGVLFVLGTGVGVMGWALVLLVKLSNLLSELKITSEDHDRRIGRLESA